MIGGRRNILTDILMERGFRPKEFVRDVLGINYQTYLFRVRKGRLRSEDVDRILDATGLTYEQIFRRDKLTTPVPLPTPPIQAAPIAVKHSPVPVVTSPEREGQKKEPERTLFKIEDIDLTPVPEQ